MISFNQIKLLFSIDTLKFVYKIGSVVNCEFNLLNLEEF